jgi:DNA-binding NtrC family response regulator
MLKILYALKTSSEEILSLLDNHQVDLIPRKQSLTEIVSNKTYDLVLLEREIDFINKVKEVDPRIEVILFSNKKMDTIEVVKRGAFAYFQLPIDDLKHLKEAIENVAELVNIRIETGMLESQLNEKYNFAGIVGKNLQMLEIFNFMRRIAPYYQIVTIMGETGTGKEAIAKTLHSLSPVSKHPFVSVNCGALEPNLIESTLFGHKKGSFTGAIADKNGLFETAGEGTIFLDEIGELLLTVQPNLLRVLQDGEFRPVGSNKTIRAKCKVITATNKDLSVEVQNQKFRDDLYYRLTPLTITIPPLCKRKEDIPLLCRHFLNQFSSKFEKKVYGISRPAQAALFAFDWPGNVRMLENVLEHASILTTKTFIRLEDLPPEIREGRKEIDTHPLSLDNVIKEHIEQVLTQSNGNRSAAAKKLNISRRALLRKMQKYSIH